MTSTPGWCGRRACPPTRGCPCCCPSTAVRCRSTRTPGSTSSSCGRGPGTRSSTATPTAPPATPTPGAGRSDRPRPPEAPGTGWGGIDADDVLAVLDAALERDPSLDAGRVGVLGGSYGGYLTSWLIGHTDRFAAACSERAVNNVQSLETSSDVAGYFRYEFGVNHLDAPELYERLSPISYVRDITTPVLDPPLGGRPALPHRAGRPALRRAPAAGQAGGVLALPRGGPRALAQRIAAATACSGQRSSSTGSAGTSAVSARRSRGTTRRAARNRGGGPRGRPRGPPRRSDGALSVRRRWRP